MVSAFPYRPEVDHTRSLRTRITPGDTDQAALLQAVGSTTAQALLCALQAEPAPASDLAEAADTSLQNAQYHLDRLCAVDLVETVDTWYSTRGRPMTVYAPTTRRLVIDFADSVDSETESPAGE